MNDKQPAPTAKRRYPGRLFLMLGLFALLAGPVLFALLVSSKVLVAPWYVPILATLAVALVAWSLVQSRTIWRWGVAGVATLFAAFVWLVMLVGMATPPYTGPATVGQAFPSFETRLASGESFQQGDLKGDKSTILVFFRGRW